MNLEQVKKDFKANSSIWKFIGLAILTAGVYPFYWLLRMLDVFQEKYAIEEQEIKTPVYLIITTLALIYLIQPAFDVFTYEIALADYDLFMTLNNISMVMSLVYAGLAIAYAITIKNIIEKVFVQNSINKKVSTLWTVIFNYFYLYFLFNKIDRPDSSSSEAQNQSAEEEDVSVKLEKLAELKEKGVLTEEEFLAEKRKLLS